MEFLQFEPDRINFHLSGWWWLAMLIFSFGVIFRSCFILIISKLERLVSFHTRASLTRATASIELCRMVLELRGVRVLALALDAAEFYERALRTFIHLRRPRRCYEFPIIFLKLRSRKRRVPAQPRGLIRNDYGGFKHRRNHRSTIRQLLSRILAWYGRLIKR